MAILDVKAAAECRFDEVSLGEVMLRLDPGETRIRTARSFATWAGGGEYNVARGLSRCFGLRTALVSALADNEVGRLIEDNILQGGVDTSMVQWVPYDGIGRRVRNGLNFTERGFGARAAIGVSDRGHTAAALMKPGTVDWEHLFGELGVRWFHTGGIFAGVSESAADVIEEAMLSARRHGTIVSYDLNYRPSQWEAFGGHPRAQQLNRRLVELVDVLVGNEEDFSASLGFTVHGANEDFRDLDPQNYRATIKEVAQSYPNLSVIAVTLRDVKSASVNSWGALAWGAGSFHAATTRPDLMILDRVGGGDSFMSGLAYGLMELQDLAEAVEYGAAHGALAMTTPGDFSMAALSDVQRLVQGASARVVR